MHLRDLVTVLFRRAPLFVGVTGAVTLAVIGLTLLITPVYESEASLRVRTDQAGGLGGSLMSGLAEMGDMAQSLPLGLSLPGGLGENDVSTEIGVLASRRILEAQADSLALHVTLARPRGAFRTDVFSQVSAGEDAPRGTYTLRRQSDGSYTLRASGTREPVALPDRVRIGEPFDVGPMTLTLAPALEADPPSMVRFKVRPFRRMMRSLRRQVNVDRADTGSRLIEISYRNADPYLAQAMVNGMVDDFIDYSLSTSQSDSRRRVEILGEEVERYRVQLADAESTLQAFQERARVIAPEEQATQQVRRIAEVQVRHDAAQVERAALANVLAALETRTAGPSGESPYRSLASFPTFLTNNGVQQLLMVLSDLENQRAQLLVRRTEANIDVRALDGRIADIETQLHTMATEYLDGLDRQIASAGEALREFGAELEAIPAVELEYVRLARDQRLLSELYLMLHAQYVDAQVQQAIDDAQVRVVDRGIIEDRPAFPRRSITFALAGMMGLMVGLFTVVSVETSNPTVRSGADAVRGTGSRLLAAVPLVGRAARGRPLFLRDAPEDPASERMRGLALALRSGAEPPRVVVVGSPAAGEGRSSVAANVALALARQGSRVALLEADLRRPVLAGWSGVAAGDGWADAPGGAPDIAGLARRVEDGRTGGHLDLFPAGRAPAHPLEVLAAPGARALVGALREAYDVVIVDVPPLDAGHDAALLAAQADGAVLVARANETAEEGLRGAADALGRAGTVLGVVVVGAER